MITNQSPRPEDGTIVGFLGPKPLVAWQVKPGDTLSSIAARFNESVENLYTWSQETTGISQYPIGNDPNLIIPGQIVIG